MNRRSILSSLSTMFVAALACPRRAEAGVNLLPKLTNKTTFVTKLYNGSYFQNSLVPGQIPLNVKAYGQSAVTLTGGAKKEFSKTVAQGSWADKVFAETASRSSFLDCHQEVGGNYPSQQTIYVLVSVATPDGKPTITQAPDGVTW